MHWLKKRHKTSVFSLYRKIFVLVFFLSVGGRKCRHKTLHTMAEWGETMPMAWGNDDDDDQVAEQGAAADSQSTVCATHPASPALQQLSFSCTSRIGSAFFNCCCVLSGVNRVGLTNEGVVPPSLTPPPPPCSSQCSRLTHHRTGSGLPWSSRFVVSCVFQVVCALQAPCFCVEPKQTPRVVGGDGHCLP